MEAEANCIFCKIVKGEIPASIVYQDDEFLCFMDIGPVSRGHCLVIPKAHSTDLRQLSSAEVGRFMATVHKLAPAICKG